MRALSGRERRFGKRKIVRIVRGFGKRKIGKSLTDQERKFERSLMDWGKRFCDFSLDICLTKVRNRTIMGGLLSVGR